MFFNRRLNQSLVCAVSSTNIIAFTTETNIEDSSIRTWGSHVYIADLNSPWQVHRILSNAVPVTILQWDLTGDLLLVADESGCVRIYKSKDYLLNEWQLALQKVLQGEHILAAAFFHSGKKVICFFKNMFVLDFPMLLFRYV